MDAILAAHLTLMKYSLLLCVLVLSVVTLTAQVITNLQITAIAKLDNGLSLTNTATSNNTNTFAALTNAMTALNLKRASMDPPKSATTNLSQFMIEFNKDQLKQFMDDYDYGMSQLINQRIPQMSEADKKSIRDIIAKY